LAFFDVILCCERRPDGKGHELSSSNRVPIDDVNSNLAALHSHECRSL
jgi:hypothetical protein